MRAILSDVKKQFCELCVCPLLLGGVCTPQVAFLWSSREPSRVKFFSWLLSLARIHTRDVLLWKTIINDSKAGCPLCPTTPRRLTISSLGDLLSELSGACGRGEGAMQAVPRCATFTSSTSPRPLATPLRLPLYFSVAGTSGNVGTSLCSEHAPPPFPMSSSVVGTTPGYGMVGCRSINTNMWTFGSMFWVPLRREV